MKIVELNSVTDKLHHLHKNGNIPGVSTGFRCIDPFYTVKKGHTTIITGHPTSGKTQFTIQLLCNLTALHGWRHLIYSPETGLAEEIYAEIIHCLSGKTFNSRFSNYITENQLYKISPFVHDYFKVMEPEEEKMGLEHYFSSIREAKTKFMINTATIDNWNDLEHNMTPFGYKISEYLKFHLPRFNRKAKELDIHGFLLAHPRNPDMKGRDNPPPPRPDEIEGGSLWYAKGQSILIVHRDWADPNNFATDIFIAKAKPKIVGKKGFAPLQFAAAYNCYFEEINGEYLYPHSPFKKDGKPIDTY